jgi:betaine-homocysteine S-methyltransferase
MTEARGRGTLRDRLAAGSVLRAEGYLFELERRGYLQAGAFVPEVVLSHPEEVTTLHREFVHAGSDVVEAFTYYGHREKLRVIGKDDLLELLNRQALALTFWYAAEAVLALEVIRDAELPAVITLAPHREPLTRDGWTYADACQRLADAGADVVGLNCIRGPATTLPLLADIVAAVDVPVAALPVPYRTTPDRPTFQSLRDPLTGRQAFPTGLDPFTCTRYEASDFTEAARDLGVTYLGLCCGAAPHHIRSMAEALGRTPPASAYTADMSKHAFLGEDAPDGDLVDWL